MRAGVAQIALCENIERNISKSAGYIRQAADSNIDILCFPECSLTGYMRNFDGVSKSDIEKSLDAIHRQGISHNIDFIIGTPYFENSTLFNAAVLMRANGSRATYFKNMLTEFDQHHFSTGKGDLTFAVKDTRCGILICRDQNSPGLARLYAEKGAEAIFYLAAHYYPPPEARRKVDKNRALPIARAVENGVYVLKANAVGSQGNCLSLGGSIIVDPQGTVVREEGEKEENVIYVDI